MEEVILKKVQNIRILENVDMCSIERVRPMKQKAAFSKLVSYVNMDKVDGTPLEEDIKIGYNLLHAIVYCPAAMVIKQFRFIDQLLASESSRTIIHSYVNFFQPGATTDETSFTLAKQFYFILASRLNLQYGNVLLATSTKAQLQAVIRNDWPFFANNTDLIEKCLQESHCDEIQGIFQKLGIVSS